MPGANHIWDVWYPNAGAQGLPFARGRMDATETLLLHAAPDALGVEVRADGGDLRASGAQRARTGEYVPITRLQRTGDRVTREDEWPSEGDVGLPVLLPGGETGILLAWWHAEDKNSWRWT